MVSQCRASILLGHMDKQRCLSLVVDVHQETSVCTAARHWLSTVVEGETEEGCSEALG